MSLAHPVEMITLENQCVRLIALANGGPRITGLYYKGGENILAETPELSWEGSAGTYHLVGGHRIWIAPEDPQVCSIPDDTGLKWNKSGLQLTLTGAMDPITELQKIIEIRLHPNQPTIYLQHRIINHGYKPYELSLWAITMLAPGGTAILPFRSEIADQSRAPDRALVLWPYSSIQDKRLELRDDQILIQALPLEDQFKIGQINQCGWVEYHLGNICFRKSFAAPAGQTYPDLGCNVEVYAVKKYIELETLSPLTCLYPGMTCVHEEIWQLTDKSDNLNPA